MNIFYLDKDPKLAAQYHCDKHVVKMCLETAQILSTIHRRTRPISHCNEDGLYKATHTHHPSTLWAGFNAHTYNWTVQLFNALLGEYKHRYNRTHACAGMYEVFLEKKPFGYQDLNNKKVKWKPPTPAMDSEYLLNHKKEPCAKYDQDLSSLHSYRNYYVKAKTRMLQYTNRERPEWLREYS